MDHKWKWEKSHEGPFSDLNVLYQVAWGFFPYKWNVVRGGRTKHWHYFMPATACSASIWKTLQCVWTTRCILKELFITQSSSHSSCEVGETGGWWIGMATSSHLHKNDLWKFISSTYFPQQSLSLHSGELFLAIVMSTVYCLHINNGHGGMGSPAKWQKGTNRDLRDWFWETSLEG